MYTGEGGAVQELLTTAAFHILAAACCRPGAGRSFLPEFIASIIVCLFLFILLYSARSLLLGSGGNRRRIVSNLLYPAG